MSTNRAGANSVLLKKSRCNSIFSITGGDAMELLEGITQRRSCRAFKPDPIPRDVIEKILEVASRSPSATNTQPWEVAVVSGEKAKLLSSIIHKIAESDASPRADLSLTQVWPAELDKRLREHTARRFKVLGIERENENQRKELRLSNFKFYGAPCAIFIFMDKSILPQSLFDIGLFSQNLILAAQAFGLESCLQLSIATYPDAVKDFLGIPKTRALVIGISLGYPDQSAIINSYLSTRISLDDFVQWYD
jgi:nitroreductase